MFSREVAKEEETSWKDLILREIAEAASKIRLGPDGAVEKLVLAGESSKSVYVEIKAEIPDFESDSKLHRSGHPRRESIPCSGSGIHAWVGPYGDGSKSFRQTEFAPP